MSYDFSEALLDIEGVRSHPTLEQILVDPIYFGLETATPLQRGIARVVAGDPMGDLLRHDHVMHAMGDVSGLIGTRPKEVYIAAGIRSGKSFFNAACIVYASFTCDWTGITAGEVPRVSIVSIDKDIAQATLDHFVGKCQQSPILSNLIDDVPNSRGERYYLRCPNGRHLEVAIVANKREGASLVSRWQALVIFDEISRFASSTDGVINFENTRAATLARIRPGGQLIGTGSPTAPEGFFYENVIRNHNRPTKDMLIIKAPGPMMNPHWWTPQRMEDTKRQDPEVYQRDGLAEFTSAEESFITLQEMDACTRKEAEWLPYDKSQHYVAAMDPGTIRNAWTLVVATRRGDQREVVGVKEWKANAGHLHTGDTMREIAEICAEYNIRTVWTDRWLAGPIAERARENGFFALERKYTPEQRSKMYRAVREKFNSGQVSIPHDRQLRMDLTRMKRKTLPSGQTTIDLPHTSDGRHCDFIPSLMMALGEFCLDKDAEQVMLSPEEQEKVHVRKTEALVKEQVRRNVVASNQKAARIKRFLR